MKIKLLSLAVLASALILPSAAKADSVIFESQTGNAYTYDLQIDNYGAAFILDGFTITGLQGVTNATLSGQLAAVFNPLGGVSFDSDSVTVATLFGVSIGKTDPYSIGTLTIFSNALPGDANFTILDSNGLFCGDVVGPTGGDPSVTPEPSTLLLLGTGLISAAGMARRKLLA